MSFTFAFLLQCKRIARRKGALICYVLLPLLVVLLGIYLPRDDAGGAVRVGVWLPTGSPAADELWQALDRHTDARGYPLEFIPAESREHLEKQVAAGAWECGYSLPQDYRRRLQAGEQKGMITLVISPATSLASLINEAVSGAMLDICAPDIAISYMIQSGILPAGADIGASGGVQGRENPVLFYTAILEDRIPEFFQSPIVMKAEIEFLNGLGNSGVVSGGSPSTSAGSAIPALLRGLIALFLFLFSCLCSLWFIDDRRSGFYNRLAPYIRPGALYLPYFCAAALFAGGEALLALLLAARFFPGVFAGLAVEALPMLLYLAWLAVVSYFLTGVFRSQAPLAAALPLLLTACLLFCPILFDLGRYIPAAGRLSALLPPTFYLRASSSIAAASRSGLAAATQSFAGYLIAAVVMLITAHILALSRKA